MVGGAYPIAVSTYHTAGKGSRQPWSEIRSYKAKTGQMWQQAARLPTSATNSSNSLSDDQVMTFYASKMKHSEIRYSKPSWITGQANYILRALGHSAATQPRVAYPQGPSDKRWILSRQQPSRRRKVIDILNSRRSKRSKEIKNGFLGSKGPHGFANMLEKS